MIDVQWCDGLGDGEEGWLWEGGGESNTQLKLNFIENKYFLGGDLGS